jgi:hypothetical protein
MHSPSTSSSHFHVELLLLFANILLFVSARAQQPPAEKSAQVPPPFWTVNRNELMAFHTANWELIGHWPLKSPPMGTSRPLVRTGVTRDGRRTVVVPSAQGLVIYTGPEMSGDYGTDKQSNAAAFAPSTNTYVNLAGEITLLKWGGTFIV